MKRTLLAGMVAATVVLSTGAASAIRRTAADRRRWPRVLFSDAGSDDANGFDHNWFDYDIASQAVLLFPDLVAAASDSSRLC